MRDEALVIRWWGERGQATRSAVLTVAIPVGAAVFITAVSVLAARAVAMLAVRGASLAWRRLGIYGRLTVGMVLAWPTADVLRALGVLPRYHVVSMLFGAVVSGTFACTIAMVRGRARRRWQRGGAMVLRGGWQDCASANAAAIAAGAARIAEVERRLEALQEGLCRAFAAAGQPPPAPAVAAPAQPALRVIRGGKSA